MALASLFTELNNAIAGNPMGQQFDATVAGMTPRTADTVNPLLGQAVKGVTGMLGGNTAPLNSSRDTMAAAEEQMSGMNMNTPEGLRQAAQVYQKLGMTTEAVQLAAKANSMEQAAFAFQSEKEDRLKQKAAEEKALKEERVAKAQAIALATNRGDKEGKAALEGGLISPQAYFEKISATQDPVVVADGAMLVGPDGKVLVNNPKDHKPELTNGYEPSVYDTKKFDELSEEVRQARAEGAKADALAQQIAAEPGWSAGVFATAEDAILKGMGIEDNPQYLRTQWASIVNSEAIKMLPKGPASDKDIDFVREGVPPKNANRETIAKYLRGVAKATALIAEYKEMQAQYVIEGKRKDFKDDWQQVLAEKEQQALVDKSSEPLARLGGKSALEFLYEDYPARIGQFTAAFGYEPPPPGAPK